MGDFSPAYRVCTTTLDSIKQAERRISSDTPAYVHLPMEGDKANRAAVAPLIFGDALASELMLSTIQTIGGSGALKVSAAAAWLNAFVAELLHSGYVADAVTRHLIDGVSVSSKS